MMGSSEHILVPEWYKSGKRAKSSNATSDSNGDGSSSMRSPLVPVKDFKSSKCEERNTSWHRGSYGNFGKSDRKKNGDNYRNYPDSKVEGRSDIDSWRKNKEAGLSSVRKQNVNGLSAFKTHVPAPGNVHNNRVTVTASDVKNSTKVGDENSTSVLGKAPESISMSDSIGKSIVEALTQAPKIQTLNEMSNDTSKDDELEARQCVQPIPVPSSMHKSTELNNSEEPKIGQLVLPNKGDDPHSASLETEILNKLHFGKLQILTRGKDGMVIPIDNSTYKDVIIRQDASIGLKSIPEPSLNVESISTVTVTALKRSASDAQKKRKDFFDSIRKTNTNQNHTNTNTADKSSSIDVNNETSDDKVVDEKEIDTVKKILKNCEINVEGFYKWEVAEMDEKDKAFMRSLGWVEDEVVEPLTREEIDSFINKLGKLRAKSKFWDHLDANSSMVQTS